jgi:transcriptional regulator with XRE-family HTH domain
MNSIGRQLRAAREAAGLRQVQVAIEAGVQPSRLCLIERWLQPNEDETLRIRDAIKKLSKGNGSVAATS